MNKSHQRTPAESSYTNLFSRILLYCVRHGTVWDWFAVLNFLEQICKTPGRHSVIKKVWEWNNFYFNTKSSETVGQSYILFKFSAPRLCIFRSRYEKLNIYTNLQTIKVQQNLLYCRCSHCLIFVRYDLVAKDMWQKPLTSSTRNVKVEIRHRRTCFHRIAEHMVVWSWDLYLILSSTIWFQMQWNGRWRNRWRLWWWI